jgi:hypothetical protein
MWPRPSSTNPCPVDATCGVHSGSSYRPAET